MSTFCTIPGFSDYQINPAGEIVCLVVRSRTRTHAAHRPVSQHIRHGMYFVGIINDSRCRHYIPVRKLVLLTFCGPAPAGTRICHKDGNPLNHHVDNLDYAPLKKLLPKVRKGYPHKLSDGDVSEIRRLIDSGIVQQCIADEFHVDKSLITYIKQGKRRNGVGVSNP